VVSLFAAFNIADGIVLSELRRCHRQEPLTDSIVRRSGLE
jgi:hypothetical protein